MSETRDRLRTLLDSGAVISGAQFLSQFAEIEERRKRGDFEIDRIIDGALVGDADDGFYLVRQDSPLDTPHGDVVLGDALSATADHISFSACDEELLGFDPRSTVFIDTETTGLAGGAGTVPFLIGVGYFERDAFRLEQFFMRDYDDEEPMLRFLNDIFNRFETVVSYNGKTFDLPLLRSRFIQNRLPFRLETTLHLDLVHVVRRFWKRRLRDCGLTNVEREVLGISRQGDVPSHEIPRIWLDYLRTRDARQLGPVFYHHRMDILSLAALTGALSRKLTAPDGEGFDHHEDRLSLLRLHFRQKNYEDVLTLADRLLEELGDDVLLSHCLEHAGFAAKRRSEWERMEHYWRMLVDQFPSHMTGRVELAKHFEHRKRDLAAAARVCRDGIEYWEKRQAVSYGTAPLGLADLEARLTRIEGKLKRAGIESGLARE